jgi:hypothetical protein
MTIITDQHNKLEFEATLFDDESTREKLNSMSTLEAMLDDERNELPQFWNHFMEFEPGLGGRVRITIEVIEETNV